MGKGANNYLIAEYMGCELEETLKGEWVYAIKFNNFAHDKILASTEFYCASELLYHKSPKWLRNVRLKVIEEGGKLNEASFMTTYRGIVEYIKQK